MIAWRPTPMLAPALRAGGVALALRDRPACRALPDGLPSVFSRALSTGVLVLVTARAGLPGGGSSASGMFGSFGSARWPGRGPKEARHLLKASSLVILSQSDKLAAAIASLANNKVTAASPAEKARNTDIGRNYPLNDPPVFFVTSATILPATCSISTSVKVFSRGCKVTATPTDFLPCGMPAPW